MGRLLMSEVPLSPHPGDLIDLIEVLCLVGRRRLYYPPLGLRLMVRSHEERRRSDLGQTQSRLSPSILWYTKICQACVRV